MFTVSDIGSSVSSSFGYLGVITTFSNPDMVGEVTTFYAPMCSSLFVGCSRSSFGRLQDEDTTTSKFSSAGFSVDFQISSFSRCPVSSEFSSSLSRMTTDETSASDSNSNSSAFYFLMLQGAACPDGTGVDATDEVYGVSIDPGPFF